MLSRQPSASLSDTAARPSSTSRTSAPLTEPVKVLFSPLPKPARANPSRALVGCRVVMLMAPPLALRPYSAPCGPFKHLHLLDVVQLLREAEAGRLQHSVNDDGDGRLGVADLREPAHVDEREADVLRLDERDLRRHADVVPHAGDAGLLDHAGVECIDRGGHVLQALGAPQRGHHDLLLELHAQTEVGNGVGVQLDGRVPLS